MMLNRAANIFYCFEHILLIAQKYQKQVLTIY